MTSTCFYLFLGQKKKLKVKDHSDLTPYTVWPVALVWYVFNSQSDRLIEVKAIKNNSLGRSKRWPRPLDTGQFYTVIERNDFLDFGK